MILLRHKHTKSGLFGLHFCNTISSLSLMHARTHARTHNFVLVLKTKNVCDLQRRTLLCIVPHTSSHQTKCAMCKSFFYYQNHKISIAYK